MSIAYTPGVAQVSRAIAADHTLAARYTWANRLVAVVSDGSAVLGLGDIGPAASLPVMEGKCALFKAFADLDSIPIVLDTKDPDEIVETLVRLRPTFGAVNLEDISAPRCFEIERRLIEALDCPVMHDDQHGTAIVVLAAMLGATKVLDRDIDLAARRHLRRRRGRHGMREHPSGRWCFGHDRAGLARHPAPGPRGHDAGQGRAGAAHQPATGRPAAWSRRSKGADVFLGLSGGVVPEELIATMAPDGIVFALSNPDPEIHPEIAAKHAAVVATGRSDFPNQINNVLAFPGVFRGALDAGARRITEEMKVAAAEAIFAVACDDLAPDRIVPSPLDPRVGPCRGRRRSRRLPERADRSAGSALVLIALITMSTAGCGGETAAPSIAVGAKPDARIGAVGPPVCGRIAVLRQSRTRAVGGRPVDRAGHRGDQRRARFHRPAACAV